MKEAEHPTIVKVFSHTRHIFLNCFGYSSSIS